MTDSGSADFALTRERLELLFTHVDEAVVGIDDTGNVVFASPALRTLTGYSSESVLGHSLLEFLHPDEHEHTVERLARWQGRSAAVSGPSVRVRHASGGWVDLSVEAVSGVQVAPFAMVITMRAAGDEAERTQALHRQLVNEDRLTRLASSFVHLPSNKLDEGIQAALAEMGGLEGVDRVCLVLYADGRQILHNTHEWVSPGIDSLKDVHGRIPMLDAEVLRRLDRHETVAITNVDELSDEWSAERDFWMLRGAQSVVAVPLVDEDAVVGFLGFESVREVREWDAHHLATIRSGAGILSQALARWSAELDLAFQARHDAVTGLGNRWEFLDRLQRAVAAIATSTSNGDEARRGVAVVVFDIDRFKVVNDSLGHAAGDVLLAEVAVRFADRLGPDEALARLGGDELVLLVTDVGGPEEAAERGRALQRALEEPVRVDGHEAFVSVSAGVAFTDDATSPPQDLLRDADAAMYSAKALGRNRVEVFDESLRALVRRRHRLEHELRQALQHHQLEVHYQPEVVLDTGRIVGAEALVRWRHPERGLLTAFEFIEIAEESGLILEIGGWVLGQACAQLGAWQRRFPDSNLLVRVNLSARQVGQPDLVPLVVDAIESSGVRASSLCLEITETTVMADAEVSLQVLEKLRGLGVELAIDDFGTGYSSLSYLKRLPVDVVKIDRSFVDGLGVDADDTSIVAAIIGLARSLGLGVTAEGVETRTQLDELLRLGCGRAQGFLLGRPCASDQFEALIAAR